jgi:hypothetical protein
MRKRFALLAVVAACTPATPPTDAPEVQVEPPPPGAESAAPIDTAGPGPTGSAAPTAAPSPPATGFPFGRPDAGGEVVVGADSCSSDADCVPATCCHPNACVARSKAPSCDAVMCTRECRGKTLDCGGGCLCQSGKCAARLMP